MTQAPQILLDHRLKSLRLPTVLREYGKLARQCATEGQDHVQFLARLVELEMIDRERRMIGLVTVTFRSPDSFMRPFAQMPRGFCRLATSGGDADCRSR